MPFAVLFGLLYLPFVALEMVLRRRVVGSHGRVLHQQAEVLGEVCTLDHVEALVHVQLTALGQACALTHALELQPLLIPDLVLR